MFNLLPTPVNLVNSRDHCSKPVSWHIYGRQMQIELGVIFITDKCNGQCWINRL